MASRLDNIVARTRIDLVARAARADVKLLERRAAEHLPRGFAAALHRTARENPAVIAELKKASPSKGLIRPTFDAASLAASLEDGGAAALSVLTDEPFFQGSLHNLERASSAVRVPCLRKDFVVDEFQMLEARAHGADAVLLIVAAHTDADLIRLRASAHSHNLDVLCEVHDRQELERALQLDCEAIGVNSRDLRDFTVKPELLHELVDPIPSTVVRVAESGIGSREEMFRLRKAGYDAFLIGEALMRQSNPGEALVRMLAPPFVASAV